MKQKILLAIFISFSFSNLLAPILSIEHSLTDYHPPTNPVGVAIETGNIKELERLLDPLHGKCNPNEKFRVEFNGSSTSFTPLCYAASRWANSKLFQDIVNVLIRAGCDINDDGLKRGDSYKFKGDKNALSWLLLPWTPHRTAPLLENVQFLIDKEIEVNPDQFDSPLSHFFIMVAWGSLDLAVAKPIYDLLLRHGAKELESSRQFRSLEMTNVIERLSKL